MIAIIMAGGRATRFGTGIEKATLILKQRTLLEISLAKLTPFDFDDIYVSVSSNTPRTSALCERLGVKTKATSGTDYHKDIFSLLDEFGSFVSLNVDSPFVSSQDVKALLESVRDVSASVVIPASLARFPVDEQSTIKFEGVRYIWLGLNYVTFSKEIQLIKSKNWLGALNINTPADLELARKYCQEYLSTGEAF